VEGAIGVYGGLGRRDEVVPTWGIR